MNHKSSLFCKKTINYELHDKSTYINNLRILQETLPDLQSKMRELEKEIENFNECKESECENYGDCQCMDTMLNGKIDYQRAIEKVKKNMQIIEELLKCSA